MSALENLRKAAMILRDPHSRDPEPVHALVAELERIATLAEEYAVEDQLDALVLSERLSPHKQMFPPTFALTRFLRQAGFTREETRR